MNRIASYPSNDRHGELPATDYSAVFSYQVSDEELENASENNYGAPCSCGGCTSKCIGSSKGSKPD